MKRGMGTVTGTRPILAWLARGWTVLCVAVIGGALAVAIRGRGAPDRVPQLAGHFLLIALSGSMAPVFRPGDLLVDRSLTAAEAARLRPGEIVTYRLPGASDPPVLVTHRIVAILSATGSGGRMYRTRGDANSAPDPAPVLPSQIVGRYVGRIPRAGRLVAWMRRPLGVALTLAAPAAYLAGDAVWHRLGQGRWGGAA